MKINSRLKQELKEYLLGKMRKDREKVVVYSSVKLSDEDRRLLKRKFSSIPFQEAEYKIDESLLAGVVIQVGSKIIDLSVRGTLSNLKHIIYESG